MAGAVGAWLLVAGKLIWGFLVVVLLQLCLFFSFSFESVRAASPTALEASYCKLADAEVVASAVWNI